MPFLKTEADIYGVFFCFDMSAVASAFCAAALLLFEFGAPPSDGKGSTFVLQYKKPAFFKQAERTTRQNCFQTVLYYNLAGVTAPCLKIFYIIQRNGRFVNREPKHLYCECFPAAWSCPDMLCLYSVYSKNEAPCQRYALFFSILLKKALTGGKMCTGVRTGAKAPGIFRLRHGILPCVLPDVRRENVCAGTHFHLRDHTCAGNLQRGDFMRMVSPGASF